ncbi:MAG: hypothetical protein H5U39_08450, partial [Deferribacterales bacterium]|nr:hypothetical protein [Deferribacterales bacterium]
MILQKQSINTQISEFNSKKKESYENVNISTSGIHSLRSDIEKLEQNISTIKEQMKWEGNVEQMLVKAEEQEREYRDKLNSVKQEKALNEQEMKNTTNSLQQVSDEIKNIELSINNNIKKKEDTIAQIEKLNASLKETQTEKLNTEKEIESLGFNHKKLEGIDDIIELVQVQQKTLHGEKIQLSTYREEIRKRIEKAKNLIDQGKCPTCGQDLYGSTIHKTMFSDEEQLTSFEKEISTITKKEEELISKMKQLKEVKLINQKIEDCNSRIMSFNEKMALAQKILEEYASRINEDRKRLHEAVSRKEEILTTIEKLKEQEKSIQELVLVATEKHTETLEKLSLAKKAHKNIIDIEAKRKDIEKLEERIVSEQEKIK